MIRPFREDKIRPPRGFSAPWFPPALPRDLEIGCGAGWHAIQYARANPDRVLIAIERTRTRFASFERRVARHRAKGERLGNLFAVHADAVAWVTHALDFETLDRIFLLYPNPYPKSSDRGRRWYAMPFMRRLIDTLKPGGEILLATNDRLYSEEAGLWMGATWGLGEVGARELSLLGEDGQRIVPRSHFEKKYLARGQTCFERRWRKFTLSS